MVHILVIDDDMEILKLIKRVLEINHYQVTTYQTLNLPIKSDDFKGFDLILLDVMMPQMDGWELCQHIRDTISTPIIFVSAKDREEDILEGLAIGGDDYITKPFSLKQLVAKVTAHLKREERRKNSLTRDEDTLRYCPPMTFYLEEKKICLHQHILPFTKREYDILELLSKRPQKVFTREEIYDRVYQDESETLFRSISEYVYQIRQKCAVYGVNPIKTVRGIGYQWYV